jgi:hypothetical protein
MKLPSQRRSSNSESLPELDVEDLEEVEQRVTWALETTRDGEGTGVFPTEVGHAAVVRV